MKKTFLAACGTLALIGCAGTDQVRLPDGSVGYALRCGNVSQCMNKAAAACGGPYEIIDTQTNSTPGGPGWTGTQQVYNASTGKYDTVAVQRGAYAGSSYKELVFACRAPKAALQSDVALEAEVQQEILRFSQDPRYPHYERLKQQMAEYLERNQVSSLEDAYAKACAMDAQCSTEQSSQ